METPVTHSFNIYFKEFSVNILQLSREIQSFAKVLITVLNRKEVKTTARALARSI